MNIALEITIPEEFTQEQVQEAVALFRGNWDANSDVTVEQAFNRVITDLIKYTIKDCLISKVSNDARLEVEQKFE